MIEADREGQQAVNESNRRHKARETQGRDRAGDSQEATRERGMVVCERNTPLVVEQNCITYKKMWLW